MNTNLRHEKEILRSKFRNILKHQSVAERQAKSRVISDLIFDLPAYRKAKAIMLYVALDEEVDMHSILQRAFRDKKHVLLPVVVAETDELICAELFSPERMKPGKYGIMEPEHWSSPFPTRELDMVLVPGLAFDKKNYRLGRGKGYYDRFLAKLHSKVSTVGLAFDVQLTDLLPVEPHDVKMDLVVHN